MKSKQLIATRKNNCDPQQGYTLIEVLIAMAIFAVGILAVGSMQISAINTNAGSRNSTTVVTYAKDRAEDLMALEYSHADLDPDVAVNPHAPAANADGIDNDEDGQIDEAGETGHISIQWNVIEADLTGDGINDSKVISITVTRAVGTSQRRASLDFVRANM
jgi:type IV pilus assembly protein PilV